MLRRDGDEEPTMWRIPAARAIAAVALLAAACQPASNTVSLDAAKKITADLQGQRFLPPPRTIADITAILDRQKPDPAERDRAIARAAAPPPANLDDNQLVDFYRNRSDAALAI